jgi:hypothetical protein
MTAHRTASVFRLPVPAGGDLARGPVVPAVWAVLLGRRGAAGRDNVQATFGQGCTPRRTVFSFGDVVQGVGKVLADVI